MAEAFATTIYAPEVPRIVEKALENSKWCQAMKVEMEALEKNETKEKCVLPHGKRSIGLCWIVKS